MRSAQVAVGRAVVVDRFVQVAESGSGRAHHGKALGPGGGAVGLARIGRIPETSNPWTPRREGGRSPPRGASDKETPGTAGAGIGGEMGLGRASEEPARRHHEAWRTLARSEFVHLEGNGDPQHGNS